VTKVVTTVGGALWRNRLAIAEDVSIEVPNAPPRWVVGMGFHGGEVSGGNCGPPTKKFTVFNLYKTCIKIAIISTTVSKSVHNWNAEMAFAVCC